VHPCHLSSMSKSPCHACGALIPERAVFCSECGAPPKARINQVPASDVPKSTVPVDDFPKSTVPVTDVPKSTVPVTYVPKSTVPVTDVGEKRLSTRVQGKGFMVPNEKDIEREKDAKKPITLNYTLDDLLPVSPETKALGFDGLYLDTYKQVISKNNVKAQYVCRNDRSTPVSFTFMFTECKNLVVNGPNKQIIEVPPKSVQKVAEVYTEDTSKPYKLAVNYSYAIPEPKKVEEEKPKPYSFAVDKALSADLEKLDLIKVTPETEDLKQGIYFDRYFTPHMRSDERDLTAQWVIRNAHEKNTVTFTMDFEGSEGLNYNGEARQTTIIPPKSARMVASVTTTNPDDGYTLHHKISFRSEWL